VSTVNLTEGIRDFPQLFQSEYLNCLEEVTTGSKNSHTSRFSWQFLQLLLAAQNLQLITQHNTTKHKRKTWAQYGVDCTVYSQMEKYKSPNCIWRTAFISTDRKILSACLHNHKQNLPLSSQHGSRHNIGWRETL
jgi:hypothetical protein